MPKDRTRRGPKQYWKAIAYRTVELPGSYSGVWIATGTDIVIAVAEKGEAGLNDGEEARVTSLMPRLNEAAFKA